MATARYQSGSITLKKRAKGLAVWEWRWREDGGKQRSKLLGVTGHDLFPGFSHENFDYFLRFLLLFASTFPHVLTRSGGIGYMVVYARIGILFRFREGNPRRKPATKGGSRSSSRSGLRDRSSGLSQVFVPRSTPRWDRLKRLGRVRALQLVNQSRSLPAKQNSI